MAPSTNHKESRARVVRELSRIIPPSSPPAHFPSPTPPLRDPDDSSLHSSINLHTESSGFNIENEAIHSTQQMETQTVPIRSTARQFRYYHPPQSQQNPPTSAVRKEFGDFDTYGDDNEDSEEESIEIGRGGRKSLRSTQGKSGADLSPNLFMSSMNFDSLYDVTPPSKSRAPTRRGNAAETGSLRRNAQIRNASTIPQNEGDTVTGTQPKTHERRKSTLVGLHARVSEEDSFQDERPPVATSNFKGTRFGNPRSRDASVSHDPTTTREHQSVTPQRQLQGTPRSARQPNKDTQQSFMLPDLPNLTELVSGVFKDGTPVFSKSARGRSRFSSAPDPNRFPRGQPNFTLIDSVPIAEDNKALFAALQLLKEKVAQLERENTEAVKTIEEQEMEITNFRAERKAQQAMRSTDSALGSTDEEGNNKGSWKVQKSKLEASVETLRIRLDRTERKLSIADTHTKRVSTERDQLQEQLTKAFVTSEEVKQEKDALRSENEELRNEVDSLRAENDELRAEIEDLRANMASNEARFEEETVQLRNNLGRQETAVQKENETLHAEIGRVRAQHNEDARRWARKEVELRNRKARQEQAELSRLKSENEALRSQIESTKAQREKDEQHWNREEAQLRKRLQRRDETISRFEVMTSDEANETLRLENEELQAQLDQLIATRDEEQQKWQRKEERLKRKVEMREEAFHDIQEITRDIMDLRHVASEHRKTSRPSGIRASTGELKRTTSGRREKDTQMRLSEKVEEEVRKSKLTSGALRRPGNPIANRFMRSTSVPADQSPETESEAESTTDLSIAHARKRSGVAMSGAIKRPSTAAQADSTDLQYTNLTAFDGPDLARLRKILEEDRADLRAKEAAGTSKEKNDTLRSILSTKGMTSQSLPRKSSMKDISTKLTTATMDMAEDPTRTKETEISAISNSHRRRRSAPVEMTSAFIIPDITVRFPQTQNGHSHNESHEAKNCTVCQRSVSDSNIPKLSATETKVEIPIPIPVSSREIEDSNATIRPAQSPQDALALVLKELQDELAHLKLELAAQEALLHSHDPALGKRKRKAVQANIQQLLKAVDVKFDQIYALYDVLEGHKADGLLDGQRDSGDKKGARMSEEEVDNTLRSVGLDPKEARKGKKVIIEETERSGIDLSTLDALDDDDDMPWSGISDTESVAEPRRSSRRSVY